jgi:3-phenylpropionate/cinnamic acid dioxygenase small subunit
MTARRRRGAQGGGWGRRTSELTDHEAIRQLLARYCLTLDVDDLEGWVALFTPDVSYEVYGRTFDGHDGLRAMVRGAPGGLHLGGPPVIELIDTDHARTRRNLLFLERGSTEMRSAVYDDELVRTDDGWRIARTRCRFLTADGLADRPDRTS